VTPSAEYRHAASVCPKARRNQWFRGKESGRLYRFDLLTCQRSTCPACRRYLTAALAARLEARFQDLPLYLVEVEEEAFEAARVRVNRRGGRYVGVPSPGGRRVVLSTVPANLVADGEPVEVLPEDRRAVLRDLASHRPMDRRQVASSRTKASTGGEDNRAGSWLSEVVPVREALEYTGHDTSKADTETVEVLAAEVGLAVSRVLDMPEVKAIRLEAHPRDPRVEHLKRRLGFIERRGTEQARPPLPEDWQDAFLHRRKVRLVEEEPPLEAYEDLVFDLEEAV